MSDLLTAKDVEVKAFKKASFGGYAIPEVEEFLNQIADDLEAYSVRLDERERRIQELEGYVKKQESMTDMIKDALIQARKSAKEMEEEARLQTEQILDQARQEAENRLAESESRLEKLEFEIKDRLDEANRSAEQILQEARAAASDILKEAQQVRQDTQKRWENLERDIAARKKEATEQVEEMLVSARMEARRTIEQSSSEVEAYESRLRFLNLQKQQFLRDTVSLLIDFGQMVDKAQQEFELEMAEKSEGTPSSEEGTPSLSLSRWSRDREDN